MSGDFYIRYGRPEEKERFLSFIDKAFGFPNEHTENFITLLPKLYCDRADPCRSNLMAFDDAGDIIGAVGIYKRDFDVCGTTLTSFGIGNVACRADKRGTGIMSALMERAVADAIASGADFSDLGGKRFRYGHFGFECAGNIYNFYINRDAIKHCGERMMPGGVSARRIGCDDIEAHGEVLRLHNKSLCHAVRTQDDIFDIISSWYAEPVGLYRENEMVGYAVINDGTVTELMTYNKEDIGAAVRALAEYNHGWVRLSVAPYETDLIDTVSVLYDGISTSTNEQISIYNYARVISAFLRLGVRCADLPDGTLTMKIHGIAGDENLHLTVSGKESRVDVADDTAIPDIELTHHDAISLLFGMCAPGRKNLPYPARAWFPLPICIKSADNV